MRNALNRLSRMQAKPTNPFARKLQSANNELVNRMREEYEGNSRARLLAEQRGMLIVEDENKLLNGEMRRERLAERKEFGKNISYLRKRGYNSVQANALALAFSKELAGLKEELTEQFGSAKANIVLREMREKILGIFKHPNNMGALIKEVRTQEKNFSQMVLMNVRNEVFEKYGVPTE
jgi:hypothetical protein